MLGKGRKIRYEDCTKPYSLRQPKELSMHAPARFFQKGKPRYQHVRGLLMMGRTPRPRAVKNPVRLCPVVAFQRG